MQHSVRTRFTRRCANLISGDGRRARGQAEDEWVLLSCAVVVDALADVVGNVVPDCKRVVADDQACRRALDSKPAEGGAGAYAFILV